MLSGSSPGKVDNINIEKHVSIPILMVIELGPPVSEFSTESKHHWF